MEPASIDLDQFLEGLRTQGEFDSAGEFTLDQRQARRKLRQYQLVEPHHYVLPLLSAAHLSGASSVELEVQSSRVVLAWNGLELEHAELEQLFTTIFEQGDGRDQRRLRELAIGLNAAAGLRPRRLRLLSGDRQLTVGSDSERISAGSTVEGIRIELDFSPFASLKRAARARLLGSLPEQRVIERLGGFAAPILRLNGQAVKADASAACLVSGLLLGGDRVSQSLLESVRPESRLRHDFAGSGPHCALFCLHGTSSAVGATSLHVVLDGIRFSCSHQLDLGVPGLTCLLVAPQLSKNLACSGIVENEVWEGLRTELLSLAMGLVRKLAREFGGLPPGEQSRCLPALRALVGHCCADGQPGEAQRVLRQMLKMLEVRGPFPDLDYLDAHYSLLLLMRERGEDQPYLRGLSEMMTWVQQVFKIEVKRDRDQFSEVMAVAYRFGGDRARVERAHLFFLDIEERILKPGHTTPFARIDELRKHYLAWGWTAKSESLLMRLSRRVASDAALLTGPVPPRR